MVEMKKKMNWEDVERVQETTNMNSNALFLGFCSSKTK